jgi:hypothetical protein
MNCFVLEILRTVEFKFTLFYEDQTIDEVVILLNSDQVGFAVIRVLGKDMNLSEIMQLGPLIEKLDLDYKDVDTFFDFIKPSAL